MDFKESYLRLTLSGTE